MDDTVDKSNWTEAEVSFAQQIADGLSEIVILKSRIRLLQNIYESVTFERNDFLSEIKALHLEYVKTDCDCCMGQGEVDDIVWGTTSNPEALSPPEIPVRVECPDCKGTGKEWIM
jgi:hypothetical protein